MVYLEFFWIEDLHLFGKHLIDVPIALENENFKTAVQEQQPLEKLETILMEEF